MSERSGGTGIPRPSRLPILPLAWNRGPNVKPNAELIVYTHESDRVELYNVNSNTVHAIFNARVLSLVCTETGIPYRSVPELFRCLISARNSVRWCIFVALTRPNCF